MVSSGEIPLTVSVEADGKNIGRAYLKKVENASIKELSAFLKERVARGARQCAQTICRHTSSGSLNMNTTP